MGPPTTKLTTWQVPGFWPINTFNGSGVVNVTQTVSIVSANAIATTMMLNCSTSPCESDAATLTIGAWAETTAPPGDGVYGAMYPDLVTNLNMEGYGPSKWVTGYSTEKCDIKDISTVLRCTSMLTYDLSDKPDWNPNYLLTDTDPPPMTPVPWMVYGVEKLPAKASALSTTWAVESSAAAVTTTATTSNGGHFAAPSTSTSVAPSSTATHKGAASNVRLSSMGLLGILAGLLMV